MVLLLDPPMVRPQMDVEEEGCDCNCRGCQKGEHCRRESDGCWMLP